MIMCGSYCQMGPGENEGKNMEKGRRKGQHNREG